MLTLTQMLFISFFVFCFFFWPCLVACGILVPWSGMEPMVLAFGARNLNHWTTGEIPKQILMCIYFLLLCKAHVVPFKHSKIWGTFYFCLQMVKLSRQTWFLTQCLFEIASNVSPQATLFSSLSLSILSVKQGSWSSPRLTQQLQMCAKHWLLCPTQSKHPINDNYPH